MPNKVELLYRHGRQGDVSTAGDSIGGCELDRESNTSAAGIPLLPGWHHTDSTAKGTNHRVYFPSRLLATLARLRQVLRKR